ncbi:unnamed protein product [Calypogeia fissa]
MERFQPLELHWVYGFSNNISNGVIDLRSEVHSHVIGYIAGTVVVIFDLWSHTQKILQGHIHQIQCIATTPDKSRIISCDCGPEAALIMWETISGKAMKAILQDRTGGFLAIDISADGIYICTLSAVLPGSVQELSIWDINMSDGKPLAMATVQVLELKDVQTCIRFNRGKNEEIISNSKLSVYIWRYHKEKIGAKEEHFLHGCKGVLKLHELKQAVGDFTLSLFPPSDKTAMTGTIDGDIVIWHELRNEEEEYDVQDEQQKGSTEPRIMQAMKVVHLHKGAITGFVSLGRYIVTGDAHGFLRFYDHRLGLIGWLEELNSGGITSISFSTLQNRLDPALLTIHVPPFLVGTTSSSLILLHAGLFEEQPGSRVCKGEPVSKPMPDTVCAIATHPREPWFALVGTPCILQIHDYQAKTVIKEREFPKLLRVSCVQYSPSGNLLAVGCTNGVFKLLVPDTLQDFQSFSYTRSSISLVEFSKDGCYIATADATWAVSLLYCKLVKVVVDIKKALVTNPNEVPWLNVSLLVADEKWECVGKYRSHAKPITGLLFATNQGGANRLFSIGQDCMIVEYDLNKSFVETGMKLKGMWQLNSLALPTAMIAWSIGNELQVITTDDGFKIRAYDAENFHSVKTFLGPVFGTAVKRFSMIHDWATGKDHLIYATKDAVIGLMTHPSEQRNYLQFMGVVAHAGPIAFMEVSHDSKFVITCSGLDSMVLVWRINIPSWDAYVEQEGKVAGPYPGVEVTVLDRVQHYFFYSQLREKIEDTVEERYLDATLIVDNMMECYNGLGLYFSKADLKGIMDELHERPINKHRETPVERVDFVDFFKIYMAHKPVIDIDETSVQLALNELGADPTTGKVSLQTLIKNLLEEGEKMTREELDSCIRSCTGGDYGLDTLPEDGDGLWFFRDLLRIIYDRSESATTGPVI